MQVRYKTNCKYLEFTGAFDNSYRIKHTTKVLDRSWTPIISWNFCCIIETYLRLNITRIDLFEEDFMKK